MLQIPIPNTQAFITVLDGGQISYHLPGCTLSESPRTLDNVPSDWVAPFETLIDNQKLNVIHVQTTSETYDLLLNDQTQLYPQLKPYFLTA